MRGTPIPDSRPDSAPAVTAFPGNLAYTFSFNEEGPSNMLFLVHFKHPFPPISEVSFSIPDSPDQVGVF
jgi:hypothetical protein